MPKILSIDYGNKRTGLAISDDNRYFAFPLDTIESKKIYEFIKDKINNNEIDTIVLGYPTNLDGSVTDATNSVQNLANHIKKKYKNINLILEDERFTSKISSYTISQSELKRKQKHDKKLIDKISAVLILQSYIGRISSN